MSKIPAKSHTETVHWNLVCAVVWQTVVHIQNVSPWNSRFEVGIVLAKLFITCSTQRQSQQCLSQRQLLLQSSRNCCSQEDPKMSFTWEGKKSKSTCLSQFLESAMPVLYLAYVHIFRLIKYFLTHNLSYTFSSKQVLFKRFFWIKFLRWATFYHTWQQYAQNNCFTLNST